MLFSLLSIFNFHYRIVCSGNSDYAIEFIGNFLYGIVSSGYFQTRLYATVYCEDYHPIVCCDTFRVAY